MKILAALTVGALLAMAIASPQQGQKSQPIGSPALRGKHASDTDRKVLEGLLLAILKDDGFPAPADSNKTLIVLHQRNPDAVEPLINTFQVTHDSGGKVLPNDAWNDLIRRNVVRKGPDVREILYEGLPFDPHIQIGDAFPGPKEPFLGKTFEEVFPTARGFVAPWAPGYSADGKTAVVKAKIGPAGRFGFVTAILARKGEAWTLVWRQYSVYSV